MSVSVGDGGVWSTGGRGEPRMEGTGCGGRGFGSLCGPLAVCLSLSLFLRLPYLWSPALDLSRRRWGCVCVIGVIVLVMFVVIPQLKDTFVNLGQSIQAFIPKVQEWAGVWFADNPEIMAIVNNLEFDLNKIMNAGFNFFKSGAGSVQ